MIGIALMTPLSLLLSLFVFSSALAAEISVSVPPAVSGHEAILEVNYRLTCDQSRESFRRLRMTPVTVSHEGRRIRLDLFEERDQARVQLGKVAAGKALQLLVDESTGCRFEHLGVSVLPLDQSDPVRALVLQHSPFVVVRPNQYANRYNDIPLAMAYATQTFDNGTVWIRYTAYFSDEDLMTIGTNREEMMARYGRRSDIEWVYQVEISAEGEVLSRKYHSALFLEIGHSEKEFQGTFLPGTQHPILYNVQDNNVFSAFPKGLQRKARLEGHHLVPDSAIEYPEARERLQLHQPWIFRVSDLENYREDRRVTLASQYLYVVFRGFLESGAFTLSVKLDSGKNFQAGGGEGDIDRLGEDLWKRETMSAIPLGRDILRGIEEGSIHGRVLVKNTSFFDPKLHVEKLRFYRLRRQNGRYEAIDLTERFRCGLDGFPGVCEF